MKFIDEEIKKELENVSFETLMSIRECANIAFHNETDENLKETYKLLFDCALCALARKR